MADLRKLAEQNGLLSQKPVAICKPALIYEPNNQLYMWIGVRYGTTKNYFVVVSRSNTIDYSTKEDDVGHLMAEFSNFADARNFAEKQEMIAEFGYGIRTSPAAIRIAREQQKEREEEQARIKAFFGLNDPDEYDEDDLMHLAGMGIWPC